MLQINLRTRQQLHSRWQLRDDVTLTDDSVHYDHADTVTLRIVSERLHIGKSTYVGNHVDLNKADV